MPEDQGSSTDWSAALRPQDAGLAVPSGLRLRSRALPITLLYAVIGCLWIFFADYALRGQLSGECRNAD